MIKRKNLLKSTKELLPLLRQAKTIKDIQQFARAMCRNGHEYDLWDILYDDISAIPTTSIPGLNEDSAWDIVCPEIKRQKVREFFTTFDGFLLGLETILSGRGR